MERCYSVSRCSRRPRPFFLKNFGRRNFPDEKISQANTTRQQKARGRHKGRQRGTRFAWVRICWMVEKTLNHKPWWRELYSRSGGREWWYYQRIWGFPRVGGGLGLGSEWCALEIEKELELLIVFRWSKRSKS